MSDDVRIQPVPKERLRDCEELVKTVFGFRDIDVVPAWSMHSVVRYGGLALGAFSGQRLVGFSYGFPAIGADGPFLYSDGLVVDHRFRSAGVGLALKQAQGAAATAAGFHTIRMPVDPLSSRPLYLFLTRLGAAIVDYLPDHYAPFHQQPFRAGGHDDVVELEWRLDKPRHSPPPRVSRLSDGRLIDYATLASLSLESQQGPGALLARQPDASTTAIGVEIPWSLTALETDPASARIWRLGIRSVFAALLQMGHHGSSVALDRTEKRAFVVFEGRSQREPAANQAPARGTAGGDRSKTT